MDEYAEYIYKRRPSYRNLDPGDISKQVEIRQRLQCKSFKWFMENVAFDLPKVYPPVEPEDFAQGAITSAVDKSFCVDAGLGTSNQRYAVSIMQVPLFILLFMHLLYILFPVGLELKNVPNLVSRNSNLRGTKTFDFMKHSALTCPLVEILLPLIFTNAMVLKETNCGNMRK